MSSHAMRQLARQKQLDAKNTYIQAMLQRSKKLAAKVDILEFENKELIGALKIKKQKRNRGKKLNLLIEENNGLQLFSPSLAQAIQDFTKQNKIDKKQYKKDMKIKKRE